MENKLSDRDASTLGSTRNEDNDHGGDNNHE